MSLAIGTRPPRHPPAGDRRQQGQVDMPHVVRSPRPHPGRRGSGGRRRRAAHARWTARIAALLQHARYCARGQVQSRSCQNLRKAYFADRGQRRAERTHELTDEVGESVDRLAGLDEGVRPLFVDTAHPVSDRHRRHQETARRLSERPTRGRAELEDVESRGRRVVRARGRGDVLESSPQQPRLLLCDSGRVQSADPLALAQTRRSHAEHDARKGDGVQQRSLRVGRPTRWQGQRLGHRPNLTAPHQGLPDPLDGNSRRASDSTRAR